MAALIDIPKASPQAFAVNCDRANQPWLANDLSALQVPGACLASRRDAPLVLRGVCHANTRKLYVHGKLRVQNE